jgi:polyhydroxybutyrate depolymerase
MRAHRVAPALLVVPLALALAEGVSFERANRSNGSRVSSGETREYLLHVPNGHDPKKAAPLVLSFHAAGLWPAAQSTASGWNRVADENDFLVVYPAGSGASRTFHVDGDVARDVTFVKDLIDRIEATHAVDRRRIYADGLSNGGGMSFALSCALPDIAAVGLVSSAQTLPASWCESKRPVPMIAFHGTEDRFTPYLGGWSPVPNAPMFPSIPSLTASWARRNGCASGPKRERIASDGLRTTYEACPNGADVTLYTIEGGGHTWPGGADLGWMLGKTTRSIDATRLEWQFFKTHPRR